MDVLDGSYWADFKKQNNQGKEVFNGELFEELIRLVLQSHFSGSWDQTSTSWDGGKDFVDRSIAGEEAWAECKMYKSSLSIKVVSNTLVMAITHHPKVKRLLLFSYSQLNPNTKLHLARFAESAQLEVQAFDDQKLEGLILSSKRALQLFFPTALQYFRDTQPAESEIIPSFSTDVHIEYAQLADIEGVRKVRKPFVPINTPCLYEVFIRSNQIVEKEAVLLDLSPLLEHDDAIQILNKEHIATSLDNYLHKELLPGELTSIKMLLTPTSTRVKVIPELSYRIGKKSASLPAIPIKVPRLNRPSLVGKPVYDALDTFETRISGKNTITLTVVSGKSGVGKTRFLEEAEMRLLSNNYQVFRMDGRDSRCEVFSSFARKLLAQLWRLPNINLFSTESNTNVRSQTGDTLFDRVCAYIYHADGEEKNLADELEQILELAVQGLITQRASVLIDNVQKLDQSTLLFLTQLSERITGTVAQAALVLAFNEDELIYSTEAALLRDRLQKEAGHTQGPRQFLQLPEFSRASVEMFLDTICGSMDPKEKFTDRYPVLTNLIYESVLPRPLDLYQLFLAAQDEDKQIARVEDGFFFVKDTDAFYELVKGVNRTTEAILTERLKSLSSKQGQLRLLVALAHIGEWDVSLISSVSSCSFDEIDYLIEGGWMRYTTGSRVDFYHPSIERFLIKLINRENRNLDLRFVQAPSITSAISDGLLNSGFAEVFPLARFALSGRDSRFLNAALIAIKSLGDSVPTVRKKLHAQSLYDFIIGPNDISPEAYIGCVQAICNLSTEGQIRNFVDRLWTCRQRLNAFVPATNDAAYSLCRIVRQYASYSNLLGEPAEGNRVLLEELPKVDRLPDSVDAYTRTKITVNYLNRRCVCLKDMGEPDQAEQVGKKALALAMQFDHKEFACLTLIDLCAIYRNEKKDWKQYCNYLEQALVFFETHKAEINELEPSIEFSCLENEAQLEGLRNNVADAVRLAEILISRTEKSYSHYYMLRGLLAKAVMICRQLLSETLADERTTAVLKDLINEIEDLSIVSRFDRFHIKALHLHALVNYRLGNAGRAKTLFAAALEKVEFNLQKRSNKSYIIPSDKALLWDAANFWINNEIDDPFPIKRALLRGTNVSDIHTAITGRLVKAPFTLFATESFNYPFP